jgi:phosphatidylserine/phosphatidylglycerophosphate/cardiolipin synthase-like enzyme
MERQHAHAKSAIADDRWARVGLMNLNIASWLTNYEPDVAIEDERVVGMAAIRAGSRNATEIVLRGAIGRASPAASARARPSGPVRKCRSAPQRGG